MIEYIKDNEVLVTVYLNDVKIAHIEKLGKIYTVEVGYIRRRFKAKNRHLITGYIKKLHFRINKPKLIMKKSILHGKYEILE